MCGEGEEHKRHTDGDWVQKQKPLIAALVAADADIFIQLAQLTVIKENETLRLVCMEGGKKPRGEKKTESVTFFYSDQQANRFLDFTHTDTLSA